MAEQSKPAAAGLPATADSNDFVIQLHLFSSFSPKPTYEVDFQQALAQLRSSAGSGGSRGDAAVASDLALQLASKRQAAVAALGAPLGGAAGGTSSDEVRTAVHAYLQVLYALVSDSTTNQGGRGSTDSPRRSYEVARFGGLSGNSRLRSAVSFSWCARFSVLRWQTRRRGGTGGGGGGSGLCAQAGVPAGRHAGGRGHGDAWPGCVEQLIHWK